MAIHHLTPEQLLKIYRYSWYWRLCRVKSISTVRNSQHIKICVENTSHPHIQNETTKMHFRALWGH